MKLFFKNKIYFSILFFFVLSLDIYVKLMLSPIPYRYLSKPLVVGVIILFCFFNKSNFKGKSYSLFLFGAFSFLIGDLFLIDETNNLFFMLGIFCFIVGKLLYVILFSNNKEFKITRVLPILVVSFLYVILLLNFIYDQLQGFLIPIVIYYFITQVLLLVVYLRYGIVNYKSYILVLLGVVAFVISETIVALSIFHIKMQYQDSAIMIFYGISQLLIVFGLMARETEANKLKLD